MFDFINALFKPKIHPFNYFFKFLIRDEIKYQASNY